MWLPPPFLGRRKDRNLQESDLILPLDSQDNRQQTVKKIFLIFFSLGLVFYLNQQIFPIKVGKEPPSPYASLFF
jgi:hypothetical protein